MKIGVLRERVSGERRVALVPDAAASYRPRPPIVVSAALCRRRFPDAAFEKGGCHLVARCGRAEAEDPQLVVKVRKPGATRSPHTEGCP